MIDAKELRIGNWVKIGGLPVHMDLRLFHAVIMGFYGYEPEPIPLSPELLIKCGFEFDGDCNFVFGRIVLHDMLSHRDKDVEVYVRAGEDEVYLINVKYLHQLQNLYFSLTQKELEVNL